MTSNQFSAVSRKSPAACRTPWRSSRGPCCRRCPTEQCSRVAREHLLLCSSGERLGVVGLDADERLVPAEHLDDGAERPQRGHHPLGRRLVRRGIDREEDGVRKLARSDPQRHPRADAERPRLVGRRRDDASLGRIATSADHHGQAGELGATQHLDGRDELVEVHVQHPGGRHRSSQPDRRARRERRLVSFGPDCVRAAAENLRHVLTIDEAMDHQADYAATKVGMTRRPFPYLVQSALAGSYIGVAVVLMLTAAGGLALEGSPWTKLVQGLVFGVALTLVFSAGGELATSNMMTLTQGAIRRTVGWGVAGGTLAFSFVGNLVGAAVFAAMVHASGVLEPGTAAGTMLASLLAAKSHESGGQLFWRGVLCNMLVCLAMWSAMRLRSEGAKLVVIFWCLLAFITSGFEHVVANMTTFSLGLLGHVPGATLAAFGRNLFFVGLGNLVGGALVVGAAYAVVAGRPAQATDRREDDILALADDVA